MTPVPVLRAAAAAVVVALALLGAPTSALAQDIAFGRPTAQAELGQPVVFSTTLQSASEPERVELLLRLPGERAWTVVPAGVTAAAGGWRVEATLDGEVPPNTRFNYFFRVRDANGAQQAGPEAEVVLVDRRFPWRTIEGGIVRLHWYEGDEAFARRALQIGERAIANASELLGVVETEPIDFFIYSTEPALRGALGRGARENVGGQAHANIRTLFGLIGPHEIDSSWVDTLVVHELTHLVFDTATDNPYHSPPRWLNEGVAVYLSEGYTSAWRATLESAVRQGTVIPLDGLAGLFPTTAEQFRLAYAESVSAVDFFIETHGEATLWELVRSYARGVSDDEAFRAATGADLAAFNAAWMASLGVDVPQPLGPRPGPPGPLPPGWDGAPATPPPAVPGETASPRPADPTSSPTAPPADGTGDGGPGADVGLFVGVVVVLAIAGLALIARRRLLT